MESQESMQDDKAEEQQSEVGIGPSYEEEMQADAQPVGDEARELHYDEGTPPPDTEPESEVVPAEDLDEAGVKEETDEMAEPAVPPVTAPPSPPATSRRNDTGRGAWVWVWSSLLGAVLGGLFGMVLALLIFAGINGSIDVSRSQAFHSLKSQLDGLSAQVDAVRGDVGTLQSDLDGLRQRVEVLSGLTARMEQVESTLNTFSGTIQSLQQDTKALQTSVDGLNQDVDTLGQKLDDVQAQTEKAMSFFDQLRTLLDDVFGAPQTMSPRPAQEGTAG